MSEIKITVLMPCYNAQEYIADAIQSVLDQSFRDFELLIVNDGSTDDTVRLIRSFSDERIVLIEQNQQGVAAALNNGLEHARAALIARFDADDICSPLRLEKQYEFMRTHAEYIIVGSAADYIDENSNYIFTHWPKARTDREIRQLSYKICPFIHASVLYRKEAIESRGYNRDAHSFEDHLLWLQLKHQGKMYNMPDRLLSVRLNAASVTIDDKKRSKEFHQIKNRSLLRLDISKAEGDKLLATINTQNDPANKKAAYYSLLAKKFLWNNYDPERSRMHIKKAIGAGRFDIKDHFLLYMSYLPRPVILNLYSIFASGK